MSESKRQVEWNLKFNEVKDFSNLHKRWPSTTAEDQKEKDLGQWWSRQKYLLNKKITGEKAPGITPEREALLNGIINDNTSFERDGIWEHRYTLIVEKFKADRKLWPYATPNIDEQKSIRWWNQQKTFARKFKLDPAKVYGGMTQERFERVVALMRVMGQDLSDPDDQAKTTEATF